jgi:hypothetical protein
VDEPPVEPCRVVLAEPEELEPAARLSELEPPLVVWLVVELELSVVTDPEDPDWVVVAPPSPLVAEVQPRPAMPAAARVSKHSRSKRLLIMAKA